MIAQGCSAVLIDRLFEASDPYSMYVCSECGQTAKNISYCSECKSSNIKLVRIPYVCKLLNQQLGALCLKTNITPEEI